MQHHTSQNGTVIPAALIWAVNMGWTGLDACQNTWSCSNGSRWIVDATFRESRRLYMLASVHIQLVHAHMYAVGLQIKQHPTWNSINHRQKRGSAAYVNLDVAIPNPELEVKSERLWCYDPLAMLSHNRRMYDWRWVSGLGAYLIRLPVQFEWYLKSGGQFFLFEYWYGRSGAEYASQHDH